MIRVGRSKTGLPTITERGGGMTNTGSARVVCGPAGERVRPLYVPGRGRALGDHAVFVVRPGLHIIEARVSRAGEEVCVKKVIGVGNDTDGDALITVPVGEYADGDGNIPTQFAEAVKAATAKARCYHCRRAHYILEQCGDRMAQRAPYARQAIPFWHPVTFPWDAFPRDLPSPKKHSDQAQRLATGATLRAQAQHAHAKKYPSAG